MKKIPVVRTIGHAYKFVFENFLAILSVMWLSWGLMLVLMFLARGAISALFQVSVTRDVSQLQGYWGQLLLTYSAILVLILVQITGLTRLSLGLPLPSRFFYFSLGKPLWRLIGAAALAAAVVMASMIAYGMAVFVLGLMARVFMNEHPWAFGPTIMALSGLISLLIGYGGFTLMILRFFFLLAPTVIAEERVSISRVWLLSRGNFWRMFLISLSIFIPFIAIEIIGVMSIAGPLPIAPRDASLQELLAFQQSQQAWQIAYATKLRNYWYLVYPTTALMSVFFYGLWCAAQSFAYQQITRGACSNPITTN